MAPVPSAMHAPHIPFKRYPTRVRAMPEPMSKSIPEIDAELNRDLKFRPKSMTYSMLSPFLVG